MAAVKKKWVAFRTNAIIPASVVGEKKDKKVNAGKPVQVPADYADHVVHDLFADECEPPKRQKKAATAAPPTGQQTVNASVQSQAVAPSTGQQTDDAAAKAKAVADAQAEVDLLNAKLAAMSEGDGEWVATTEALDTAVTALAAAQEAAK